MKRLLITGAGGFVGRSLAEYLAANSQYSIFATKRIDLNLLDEAAVQNYLREHKINFIIHCANAGGSRKTNYDSGNIDITGQNLRMFFNLERCLTPDMRMIYFGSGAEYDKCNYQPKMPEEYFDTHVPADAYGFSKYIMAKFIQTNNHITCFRIFGLFGPYEDYRFRFISNAIVKNLLGMPILINQNVVFDYLFVDDLCKIVHYFIEHEPKHRHYNMTPTHSIDLISLAQIVNEISNYKSEILVLNDGMNTEYSGDNSRVLTELGDFVFTPYEQAISQLYGYYQSVIHDLDLDTVKQDPYIKLCHTKKSQSH